MGDLVKRLRYAAQGELFGDTLYEEAADRIEELETAERNYEVITEQHRKRIAELEATIDELPDENYVSDLRYTIKNLEAALEQSDD